MPFILGKRWSFTLNQVRLTLFSKTNRFDLGRGVIAVYLVWNTFLRELSARAHADRVCCRLLLIGCDAFAVIAELWPSCEL